MCLQDSNDVLQLDDWVREALENVYEFKLCSLIS